jgi:hypothetical protein
MAFTTTQLAAVETAIATGALRVEFDGRVIIYQKMADLLSLRDQMKAELGVEVPPQARGRAWNPVTGSGL